jgi:hypothetical protein
MTVSPTVARTPPTTRLVDHEPHVELAPGRALQRGGECGAAGSSSGTAR